MVVIEQHNALIAVVLTRGGGEREVNIIPFDKWGGGVKF